MSRLPVRDLAAQEVADLVAVIERRRDHAQRLTALGPALGASYAMEAAVCTGVLADLELVLRRRPLAE